MSNQENPRISRLIAIVVILQSKALTTSTMLSNRFNVSVRTIYRDMKVLEQAGIPLFIEEGKGYKLMEGYRLAPIMFTEDEANAFITAEKLVLLNKDSSLTQNYIDGTTKIKSVLRKEAKEKVSFLSERVAFQDTSKNQSISHYLAILQKAITDFNIVQINYKSANNILQQRMVEPFAVINNVGSSWYLIAWCRLRNDFRLFRFDRITNLEVLAGKFIPHDITLQEYLTNYRNKI
jgi:predicted DNA-binding transcriptional regulator YafY